MMETGKSGFFKGFSPESLGFLHDVHWMNSREWFESRRGMYERCLLDPLRALVVDLSKKMSAIDPFFEVRPLVNKTISRIYRDTRFSRDKSLFKDRMWLTFKRPGKDWKDRPAYYFELTPDSYRYGMGYYSAAKRTMDLFRAEIDRDPGLFGRVVSFYGKGGRFSLEGEKYKRSLKSGHPPELQEWYQRRSFYLACNKGIDETLFSSRLSGEIASGFETIEPIYRFLMKLKE